MRDPELRPTVCAICGVTGNTAVLYPGTFTPEELNPTVFSARRLPDRVHYRVVRCMKCGLVRSDPTVDPGVLAKLYEQSAFDYDDETSNLKRTYGRYLAKLDRHLSKKDALLEIGCGNGFLLEVALCQGYRNVAGVEPSAAAVARADLKVRSGIVCDVMRPGLFPADSFDAICMFQVLDHIPDPASLLDECFRVLRPGGVILCLNHNIEALSARLLGERSPIIDIEHTYLYSPTTLSRLFEAHGYRTVERGSVINTYSIAYLCRLLPIPSGLKRSLVEALGVGPFKSMRLSVPLGNLYLIAQKSADGR